MKDVIVYPVPYKVILLHFHIFALIIYSLIFKSLHICTLSLEIHCKFQNWLFIIYFLVSPIKTIALVPGSGGSLLKGIQADLFVTGEMFHHDVLDANHNGSSVILTNHSDSERGFLAKMAVLLNGVFKDIKVEISCSDADPLKTV